MYEYMCKYTKQYSWLRRVPRQMYPPHQWGTCLSVSTRDLASDVASITGPLSIGHGWFVCNLASNSKTLKEISLGLLASRSLSTSPAVSAPMFLNLFITWDYDVYVNLSHFIILYKIYIWSLWGFLLSLSLFTNTLCKIYINSDNLSPLESLTLWGFDVNLSLSTVL